MNWSQLFIGIALLGAACLIYRMRKWDLYSEPDQAYQSINSMKSFNTWLMIILATVVGLVLIIRSIP